MLESLSLFAIEVFYMIFQGFIGVMVGLLGGSFSSLLNHISKFWKHLQ